MNTIRRQRLNHRRARDRRPASGFAAAAEADDKVKVGFVYVGPVGDHGWTYRHDIGRQAVEEALRRPGRDDLRGKRQGRRRTRSA